MLRGIVLFVLVFFLQTHEFSGKVIAVLDGDTIEVLKDGQPVRIRLSGIDCPEKSQAFGNKAKEFTASKVAGKTIIIKSHGMDRYNRVLGDVYLVTGIDTLWLNRALVQAGFAWHYKRYSDDEVLSNAEILAKKQKIGLWSDPAPMAPWEFRKQRP